MAFNGSLIKVGEYEIPSKYIKFNTYKVYRNTLDLDSYRDGYGVLHRNALEHKPNKVEFETPPMLTNDVFAGFMKSIQENYIEPNERKASVTLYIPEIDDYVTQDMYMPDPQPSIYLYNRNTGKLYYNAIGITFIGY